MGKKITKVYACDFETTVYDGQDHTEVWSSAGVELYTEKVWIHHSIKDTMGYFMRLNKYNIVAYYHNLKFDGSFWVDWLLNNGYKCEVEPKMELEAGYFRCVISDLGQWYKVEINTGVNYITLKDSLKLMPFTLKQIGKAFKTKHQKLEMEYTGYRYAGCYISPEEMEYIKNDVLVLKEALEFMFSEGHNSLTIGSCCLKEYKKLVGESYYDDMFPDLTKVEINPDKYGASNADEYIRRSYHGGWCYVVPEKTNQIKKCGVTADVNSLYPSMMSSESGNRYPVGLPTWWSGDYIPEEAQRDKRYFFITIKCRFRIKKNHLPFIQIKGSTYYRSTECLTDSWPTFNGKKQKYIEFGDGKVLTDKVQLTLTQTDYQLLHDNYEVSDEQILHGCYFFTDIGIFDIYIDKYRKIKQESKGAMRTLAKLFLNNLYGKMSSSDNSSYQYPYIGEDGTVHYMLQIAHDKQAGFIAVGSAITSYARNFTIRSAQQNYYGSNKRGFIYADTDSIHCDLKPEEVKGIRVHPTAFCAWKLESSWDRGIFVRQKTYIEHVTHEDLELVEKPYYNVKCAGMPQRCKNKFINAMETGEASLKDFKVGLCIDGKLLPKRIKGGLILSETTFQMR